MNIVEQVRKFLLTYPPLREGKLHVDFLPEEAKNFSIEAIPAQEIVRCYLDGSSIRQFIFVLASREFYSDKINEQLDNLEFYMDFSEWLREQTMMGNFPDLGEGRKCLEMTTTTSGYAMTTQENTARYQIQCRMEFFQKK